MAPNSIHISPYNLTQLSIIMIVLFQSSIRGVDELISTGSSSLDNLKAQKNKLKNARRRVLDLWNTLGLSNTTISLIERRAREDKYILIGGMLVTLVVIILVIMYVI